MERKLDLGNRLGRFWAAPYITVMNEGGSNLRLGTISLEMDYETGKKVLLRAETYQSSSSSLSPQTFGLPLHEVILRPGAAWAGQLVFNEQLSPNEEEELNKLEEDARRSSKDKYSEHHKNAIKVVEKVFARMADGKPPSLAVPLDLVSLFSVSDRFDPDEQLLEVAKKIFDKNVTGIEKGEHEATLTINSASDIEVYRKKFRFTLYESHLARIRKSFETFGSYNPQQHFYWESRPVAIKLKDVL
jgi:hypothetical protein